MRYIGAVPRLLQIGVLSAAFVLPGWEVVAMTKDGSYGLLGGGQESCGAWSAAKGTSQLRYAEGRQWLEGYLSSYNRYVWPGNNVASETDTNGFFAWVDNYCSANPTKDISDAAEHLVEFLSSGPHPNDKH